MAGIYILNRPYSALQSITTGDKDCTSVLELGLLLTMGDRSHQMPLKPPDQISYKHVS
jgi:hypothetical protein